MHDPLEGLSESGTIRTGADIRHVAESFRPVHQAVKAMIHDRETSASVYAYGSVVTGRAKVGVSDVDLLTIGLPPSDAKLMGAELSARFANVCRGVEIGAAEGGDFVGENDESYGNQVFLRHYFVLLAGSDAHRPKHDFAGDRRAARGFNGDIAQHAQRWRNALEAAEDAGLVAMPMARKSLLAEDSMARSPRSADCRGRRVIRRGHTTVGRGHGTAHGDLAEPLQAEAARQRGCGDRVASIDPRCVR